MDETTVRIEYSDRKTLGLFVERDSSVLVRAPRGTPTAVIESFLEKKRYWIWEKTNHSQKYTPVEHDKEFVTGESFLFVGRRYPLELTDEEFDGLRLEQRFLLSRTKVSRANAIFFEWYVVQATERIVPRVRLFAERMGVQYDEIMISDLSYRWGSCTPKNKLNFNWRLIKAPSHVIDYIIVHELAHLIEANHTPTFWNIVAVQVPNYQKAREWLTQNGGELEIKP